MERYQFSAEERNILEKMPQPMGVYQVLDGRIEPILLSDGFCRLFDYSDREEAIQTTNHDVFRFLHPDDTARVKEATWRFAGGEDRFDVFYRTRQRDGSNYMVIHATGESFNTETGERIGYIWYADEGIYSSDETERDSVFRHSIFNALHEESLVKASRYDALTGLPNMTYFFELAQNLKNSLKGDAVRQAKILYFNLHGMKIYNTRNSFAEGDKLLQEFANLLGRTFSGNHCCHVAADQFAVITTEGDVEGILKGMLPDIRKLNGGKSLPVHVGIFADMTETIPVSIACDRAKFACDALKNSYESSYRYYDREMRDDAFWRQYILSHLDQAIEERWIRVYYQALVRAVNGRVSDEEALARWVDPERGLISPIDFIPFLEEAGVIYKLDLCVLEQVLEKIHLQEAAGYDVVPQSINLSRADFDACDIVEEIRKRVDAAGVSRDKITIEITESTVGSDAGFMKKQIERFRELGFPVWLDDFGSGYSSLEILQTLKVDLLKFDMSFMRRLDEGDEGKIILTELMRMATALGIDTACEGVEKEEQTRFLRDIGCSKMQGFYYTRPISLEDLLIRYEEGLKIGYEDPEEAEYYEKIGQANLYDIGVIASKEDNALHKTFSSLPMGIIEVNDRGGFFVRSNQSYRDFMRRFFSIDLSKVDVRNIEPAGRPSETFFSLISQCIRTDDPILLDEELPDGSVIHSFARKIAENPAKKKQAVAVAVLSVSDSNQGTTYADIARALAADYYNIYYVDLTTDQFIEYSSPVGGHELAMERHGENFFESAKRDTMVRIYEEDREFFLTGFTKENILMELDQHGVFQRTYRLIDTGSPMYVNMKIMRMRAESNAIIIGISIVDSHMKQQEINLKQEKEEYALARVMAMTGDYLCLYTVDPQTGAYTEYITTEAYEKLGLSKQGEDFFLQGRKDGRSVVFPEDQEFFLQRFQKETILQEIREKDQFQLHYRLVLNGEVKDVSLKIVSVREKDGEKLLAGVRIWKERK